MRSTKLCKVVSAIVFFGIVFSLAACTTAPKKPRTSANSVDANTASVRSSGAGSISTQVVQYNRGVPKEVLRRSLQHRIAADMLSTLVQIVPLVPESHSIQVGGDNPSFNTALRDVLTSLSFQDGMIGSGAVSRRLPHKLSYSVNLGQPGVSKEIFTYLLSVDGVRVKRAYEFSRNNVRPLGGFSVSGSSSNQVNRLEGIWK